jgi:hypothetical protein
MITKQMVKYNHLIKLVNNFNGNKMKNKIKKIINIIILILLSNATVILSDMILVNTKLMASINDAKLRINITNEISQKTPTLYIGVDTNATDLYDKNVKFIAFDTVIREEDLPPFPPFDNIYAALLICCDEDNSSKEINSYVDFRAIPEDEDEFYRKYLFYISWNLNYLNATIKWDKLPNGIDSAKIIDTLYTESINCNMNENDSVVVKNPTKHYNTLYIVKIWFNKNTGSIKERPHSKQNKFTISPNPANDAIFIKNIITVDNITTTNNVNEIQAINYTILSLIGQKLDEGIYNNKINISNLDKGLYFIKLQDASGNIYYNKFIKY